MVEAQGDEHVVDARHRRRAVDEQLVRPLAAAWRIEPGTAIRVRPRSLAALAVIRLPPRVARLDDNEHLAECGDDAIAQRKMQSSGGDPGGHSDTSNPLSATHCPDVGVLLGIRDVDAVADHADGAGRRPPDAAMCGTVDAARQTGHDGDARVGERLAEFECRRPTGGRCVAGSHDRDPARRPTRRGCPVERSRPAGTGRRRASPESRVVLRHDRRLAAPRTRRSRTLGVDRLRLPCAMPRTSAPTPRARPPARDASRDEVDPAPRTGRDGRG